MTRADLDRASERTPARSMPAEVEPSKATNSTAPDQRRVSTRTRVVVVATLLLSFAFCVYRIAPVLLSQLDRPSLTSQQPARPPSERDWELAMQSLDAHETAVASNYIRRSLGHDALCAHRAILQGRLFLESRKLFAARHAFQEAMDQSSLRPIASYWLGATCYAMADIRAAEQYWLATLDSLPHDANTHRSLAMIYYDRGAIDHAVQHLKEVASIVPTDARPYRLLGLVHKDYERYSEAIELYRAALDRELAPPTREQVRRELTECLLKTREYEAGLALLEQGSMTYDAMVLKAECLVGLGRSDEAVGLLEDVLSRERKHFAAQVALAGICMEKMNYAKAVELLRQAIELRPADYLANFRLAQSLRSLGQNDEASTIQKRADEIKSQRERFSELHQEATAKPLDAEVRYQLGLLAAELDLAEIAATWFRAAVELNPNHAAARKALSSSTTPARIPNPGNEPSNP